MAIDTTGKIGNLDVTYDMDGLCGYCRRPVPPPWTPHIPSRPVPVAGVLVHRQCREYYLATIHWKTFTPEQQKKIIENRPRNVLHDAIWKYRWGWWFEVTNTVANWISNWLRGVR